MTVVLSEVQQRSRLRYCTGSPVPSRPVLSYLILSRPSVGAKEGAYLISWTKTSLMVVEINTAPFPPSPPLPLSYPRLFCPAFEC